MVPFVPGQLFIRYYIRGYIKYFPGIHGFISITKHLKPTRNYAYNVGLVPIILDIFRK